MSYRKLEIWQLASEISVAIHKMTLTELPKFEMFEQGCQIRRSSHSIRSNIVEGYGRRKYLKEYVRFLIFSLSSNDETLDHLDTLWATKSLSNEQLYLALRSQVIVLGKKLNRFIAIIERRSRE